MNKSLRDEIELLLRKVEKQDQWIYEDRDALISLFDSTLKALLGEKEDDDEDGVEYEELCSRETRNELRDEILKKWSECYS